MENTAIKDPLFREAVEYIDSGDLTSLEQLLQGNPPLAGQRLDLPDEGYFKDPYLLWFIADNPIRRGKLPANIAAIAAVIIGVARRQSPATYQYQVDYALGLVAKGRIPRECGVQIELIDLLIDSGAKPGGGLGAVAHGNLEAARRLIERGGTLTLATAVCLDRTDRIPVLIKEATQAELEEALVAAAFYGNLKSMALLIERGVNVNAYLKSSSGFHTHATALHQAVYSGSLDAVKMLIEAGADLEARDKVYQGTPMGWAKHMQTEDGSDVRKERYKKIELYLEALPA